MGFLDLTKQVILNVAINKLRHIIAIVTTFK